MVKIQNQFKRYEIKYLLDARQYESVRRTMQGRTVGDEYGKSTICNIYYDTPDRRLIRRSLEKPVYKEKMRLRSYGTPHGDDRVFLELKKKYETEATPWGCGSAMGVTQFIDTYDPEDSRLADSWLMGEQRAADGSPLYGTYDKMGEPLVYTKDLPDGNYTSEMEGFRMNKFEIVKGEQSSSETDVPLFRYAEVLLMKAECLLRSGKPGAGLLVTEVRKRAFKDNPELAIVTDAQLQENSSYQYGYVEHYTVTDKGNTDLIRFGRMYDELGWEFAWEMHRRRDAIRFGVYTKKSWLSHKPQGDYRSVFPIPEKVLTSNPNLEQNPHYK